jgi:hypothetical protein
MHLEELVGGEDVNLLPKHTSSTFYQNTVRWGLFDRYKKEPPSLEKAAAILMSYCVPVI